MAEEFKVSLGIELESSALKSIKTQLNNLTDNNHRIRIDIDNSRLLKQINHAKKELKDLSGIKGNNRPLEINTKSLEQSFNRIANVIDEIRISIGTFGQDANMKPLLASINEISISLSEASRQFKELSGSFNGFNLNFNLGGNKNQVANNIAYAEKIKSNVIPQLKEQARQLEEYLKTVYKVEDGQEAVIKLASKTGEFSKLIGLVGKESFVTDDYDANYKEVLSTYREYIALIERAAKTRGVDLSSVTSSFSKSADQMMQDARKIQTGETEAEESMQRLQKVFGGSNIDAEGLTIQLDSIIGKLTEIGKTVTKLSSGISIDGLTESFSKLSSSIQQIVDNCAIVKTAFTTGFSGAETAVGQSVNGIFKQSEEIASTFRELSKVSNKIKNIDTSIAQIEKLGKGTHTNEINELRSQLNALIETYNKLESSLNGQLSSEQLTKLAYDIADTINKLAQLDARAEDTKADLAKGIKLSIEAGDIEKEFSKINAAFKGLETQSDECKIAFTDFNIAFTNLKKANMSGDNDALINAQKEYEKALKKVNNQLAINTNSQKQANKEQKKAVAAQKLDIRKDALTGNIDVWLKKNTAAAKQFRAQLEEIKSQIASADSIKLDKLEAQFENVNRQAELLDKKGLSFGDKFKNKFKEYATYFSAASMFNYVERGLRSMYDNVVEVDTAMTGLYRVTDLTAIQYDTLYDNMVSSAKEYGSTLTDVINSTADWVRLGFDENEAVELSEITAMYQHISDLDYDVAVENLVTAYKGFQDQLLNLYNGDEVAAVRYIADIFNELDNNYAVTADDIGAALTRSASALELAGNTIQESAAMVTGITEVTQDPEKAGKMYARTYSNVWCNL